MDFDWRDLAPVIAAAIAFVGAVVGAVVAAVVAACTYRQNLKIERAKWWLSLYEKFYERPDLKPIRESLDNEADHEDVLQLVLKCSPEFTDYLNFFEFVAFLEKGGQLRRGEIAALFDYYLKCLQRHPRVLRFIDDHGFESLQNLLKDWK